MADILYTYVHSWHTYIQLSSLYMRGSDIEQSHSKQVLYNNCNDTTFWPQRSSPGECCTWWRPSQSNNVMLLWSFNVCSTSTQYCRPSFDSIAKSWHNQVLCKYLHTNQCCCMSPVQEMERALLNAAEKGDLDKGKQLLEQGCPLNAQDKVTYTCTHACMVAELQLRMVSC